MRKQQEADAGRQPGKVRDTAARGTETSTPERTSDLIPLRRRDIKTGDVLRQRPWQSVWLSTISSSLPLIDKEAPPSARAAISFSAH